ncbi:MAG: diacylglycerol kinase family lipid kinase [Gemmatimonadota bacterium]|nr:diacylglycerol kinase family lipid kinase [Gemmatimonadota bacterium]
MGLLALQDLALVIGRALLVVNPASRRGTRDLRRVEAALADAGATCETRLTRAPGDAGTLARDLGPGYDALFALGGDGTIMEALGGLAGGSVPLGALAGGTGNLFARAFGIPLDPARAVRALCAGRVRAVDLVRLDRGGYFAVAAGIGIDVAMIENTPSALKRQLGVAAYVLAGAQAAIHAARAGDRFRARIVVDGAEHEVDALSLLVANVGAVLDGRITLAPGVVPDDGLIDVAVYAPRTLGGAFRVAWRMLRGRFPDDGLTRFFRGRHVRVTTVPPRRAEADGELLPPGALDARVLPGAGLVLVPAGS